MFDEYARQLIDLLPDLPDIDRVACRRALSTVYFYIVQSQLSLDLANENIVDLNESRQLLRQMVDALESVAIFDRLNGQSLSTEVETACAFVAAESLYLLDKLPTQAEQIVSDDPILQEQIYTAIESAILYMVGGYDINSVSVVSDLIIPTLNETATNEIFASRINNANALLSRLILFCRGDVRLPRKSQDTVPIINLAIDSTHPSELIHKIRSSFYLRLSEGIDAYLDWLGGYSRYGLDEAIRVLLNVRVASLSGNQSYTEFADIYHLSSLLLAAIGKTSQRTLIHSIPLPIGINEESQKEFIEYLNFRAQGDEHHRGRPFLWPSAVEYIKSCLPGPNKDAVISMPTGSGKSYIAELAIVNALISGWVLYLAPTNALVYQVRRDLIHALKPFQRITVCAFIGDNEYTALAEEQINILNTNFVAVMTPEKCSLALRLYPEKFANCSLCVFDECHLINDANRGVTSDILLAQLSLAGQSIHFILMSAMVSNPEQLARWLASVHDASATPLVVKWRPSRTMRGLLLIDKVGFDENYRQASAILGARTATRKNEKFDGPLAIVTGLSGPWTLDGAQDYRISSLPIKYIASATKTDRGIEPSFDGWKNTSSRQLAELFAQSRIPTICFILTSRHHTFSSADKVEGDFPDAIGDESDFPELVEAWLAISDAELGKTTVLRNLLRRGIAVHSSAMLQTEQAASEWMFQNKKAQLMFATGTLAQGLNLPAVAVVIAGTSMGDPRDQISDGVGGIERVNSMILNGFGRAGRPGFANQGLAILVSDLPYRAPVTMNLDPSPALNQYPVLGEQDAVIEIHSPVELFIDTIMANDLNPLGATKNELVLTSLLAEYDQDDLHSGMILTRTLAAYHKRNLLNPDSSALFRNRLNLVRENYFSQADLPKWLNKAAMIAGVDYFRALRVWQAFSQVDHPTYEVASTYNIYEWMNLFFSVLSLLPPKQIQIYLPDPNYKTLTVLTRMRDSIANQTTTDLIPWIIPGGWSVLWQELRDLVIMYMRGDSFSTIAQGYLNLTVDQIQNKRTRGDHPIPAVFGFLNRVVNQLAIDAGCFAAIYEMSIHEHAADKPLPETLQALPLCIRQGCDSLGSLAWYRFGYRQRVCAHALQRNFPVPDELNNDSERAAWVRQTRGDWLANKIVPGEQLLNYAKIVLIQTENQ